MCKKILLSVICSTFALQKDIRNEFVKYYEQYTQDSTMDDKTKNIIMQLKHLEATDKTWQQTVNLTTVTLDALDHLIIENMNIHLWDAYFQKQQKSGLVLLAACKVLSTVQRECFINSVSELMQRPDLAQLLSKIFDSAFDDKLSKALYDISNLDIVKSKEEDDVNSKQIFVEDLSSAVWIGKDVSQINIGQPGQKRDNSAISKIIDSLENPEQKGVILFLIDNIEILYPIVMNILAQDKVFLVDIGNEFVSQPMSKAMESSRSWWLGTMLKNVYPVGKTEVKTVVSEVKDTIFSSIRSSMVDMMQAAQPIAIEGVAVGATMLMRTMPGFAYLPPEKQQEICDALKTSLQAKLNNLYTKFFVSVDQEVSADDLVSHVDQADGQTAQAAQADHDTQKVTEMNPLSPVVHDINNIVVPHEQQGVHKKTTAV